MKIDKLPEIKTLVTNKTPQNRKHNHLPQGKFGFIPRPCSDQVNIKKAKR